jgi:hypothetical protein
MSLTLSGSIFTDATNLVDCPKCGSKAGYDCRTPSGRKASTPHGERQRELSIQRPDAIKAAQVKGSNIINDIKEAIEVQMPKVRTKKVLTEEQQADIKARLLAKVMFQD